MTAVGGVNLETATVKFGTAALNIPAMNPATSVWLTTPLVANGPLDLTTGNPDFTVEGFFYSTTTNGNHFILFSYNETNASFSSEPGSFQIVVSTGTAGTNLNNFGVVAGTDYVLSTVGANYLSITANAWHHFALVNHAGTWTGYIDGTSVFSGTCTFSGVTPNQNITFGYTAEIGGFGSGYIVFIIFT